jgi:transcriptional regulator with XRE-family HTH domain
MRREVLRPEDAATLGGRKLRELALTNTYGAIAKRAKVNAEAIRRWARETSTPTPEMRLKLSERLGLPEVWWATRNDATAMAAVVKEAS